MKRKTYAIFTIIVTICLTIGIQATEVYVPQKMNPGTIIHFNENLEMEIISTGRSVQARTAMLKRGVNTPANIQTHASSASYTPSELAAINEAKNNVGPVYYAVEDEAGIEVKANTTVYYDGTGSIFSIEGDSTFTMNSPRLTSWTYPANGTYYYGSWTPQNWIKLTDEFVMGQGYVTYFIDEMGYHGDNLDDMEEDDESLNICATRMDYDRPNRAQSIKLRVLDDDWADTEDVYYVNKYDIGGLPEAVLDIRERLFSEITDLDNGIFHGRYYYEKVPLTDPY